MDINKIRFNPSFCSNKKEDSTPSIAKAINTATQKLNDFDDIVIMAKNAVDSPEDAAMRTLHSKLDDLVNDEKTPKGIKKPASYAAALLISGVSFFATKKVMKAPAKFAEFAKSHLGKYKFGTRVLEWFSSLNKSKDNFIESLKNSKLGELKQYAGQKAQGVIDYITKKFPALAKKATDVKNNLKLNEWSRNDYLKNGAASVVAISSGYGYLNRCDKKARETVRQNLSEDAELCF